MTSATSNAANVILFSYDISVFGRKIEWYLMLRGIKYSTCIQPNRMPRPDLNKLGISYRRIPIVAIGRDIYCDTRIIIDKLEQLYPEDRLGSTNQFEQGLEKILSTWSQDGGPFSRTVQCIPAECEAMQDPMFLADRSSILGSEFSAGVLASVRAEALAHQKLYLEPLEHGMLADGRDFILDTAKPTLADLHAVWTFDWLTGDSMRMGEMLEPDVISSVLYPKVYAWIRRFRDAVNEAARKLGPSRTVSSEDAIVQILESETFEKEGAFSVDELDPLRLKKGQVVQVYPSDYGSSHKDQGQLIALCSREVVIRSEVKTGNVALHLHFPRTDFRIEAVPG